MKTLTTDNLTRINNDVNGSPRYVVHFTDLLPDGKNCSDFGGITEAYKLAVKNLIK